MKNSHIALPCTVLPPRKPNPVCKTRKRTRPRIRKRPSHGDKVGGETENWLPGIMWPQSYMAYRGSFDFFSLRLDIYNKGFVFMCPVIKCGLFNAKRAMAFCTSFCGQKHDRDRNVALIVFVRPFNLKWKIQNFDLNLRRWCFCIVFRDSLHCHPHSMPIKIIMSTNDVLL